MSHQPKREVQTTDWQFYLERHERNEYEALKLQAGALDQERRALTDQMNRIVNRCAQRRRHRYGNISV